MDAAFFYRKKQDLGKIIKNKISLLGLDESPIYTNLNEQ